MAAAAALLRALSALECSNARARCLSLSLQHEQQSASTRHSARTPPHTHTPTHTARKKKKKHHTPTHTPTPHTHTQQPPTKQQPGSKLLYLGAASGTSVSHCSDLVGPTGTVYAVEFSHRSGRDLVNMAKQRPNVVPIIEDARHPQKYRMLVPMVDVVFADVAQPDQARIVALNAQYFLKNGGNFVISIKASCIDSTAAPEAVFSREVAKLKEAQLKPKEQVSDAGWPRCAAILPGLHCARATRTPGGGPLTALAPPPTLRR